MAPAKTRAFLLASALALLLSARRSSGKLATFSNVKPRTDSATGKILELGDGSIAKFGDRFAKALHIEQHPDQDVHVAPVCQSV
jgi:hypothetical protein